MLQGARSAGGGADDESAIGHGLGDRRELARGLEHMQGFYGGAGFPERDVIGIHQPHLGKAEIAHGSRGRADVQRIARIDQNYFQRVHCEPRCTASEHAVNEGNRFVA